MDWKERMRHDCKSMSGCSGGPVIANGRVVGVQQDGDVQQGYAANFVTVEAVVREWAGLEDGQAAVSCDPYGFIQLMHTVSFCSLLISVGYTTIFRIVP